MSDEEQEAQELKPLDKKQERVLDEYLICWVQYKAYQAVFPKVSYTVARALSSRMFADANFKAHLQARLNEVHMSANEALKLRADVARGDIGELMITTPYGFTLNLEAAKKAGLTKLIKRVEQRTEIISGGKNKQNKEITVQKIELYSAAEAQNDILKVHGKLTEKVDITSNGKEISQVSQDQYNRSVSALADALRKKISGKG